MSDDEEHFNFEDNIGYIDKFIKNLYVFFETGEISKDHDDFVLCYT